MPKAYAVVTYRSVSDPEKLAASAELALPAVKPFGARILARGNAAVAREHGLKERTVVTEFPSLEKATAAYDSAAYEEALKALGDGAVRDFRIVEGVEYFREKRGVRPTKTGKVLGSKEHYRRA
jgi:uncharacterized protein (DUF1330 family)